MSDSRSSATFTYYFWNIQNYKTIIIHAVNSNEKTKFKVDIYFNGDVSIKFAAPATVLDTVGHQFKPKFTQTIFGF